MAKNKNQKNNNQPIATPTQPKRVRIVASDLYHKTLVKYSKRPQIVMALAEFIAFKRKNPLSPFGSKDHPFINSGPLRGYMHSGLNRDIQIVYTSSGTSEHIITLHGVFSHDELGTGTPAKINKQVSAASSFNNAKGIRPLEQIDESTKFPLIAELLRM